MSIRRLVLGLVIIAAAAVVAILYLRHESQKLEDKYRTEVVDRGTVAATVTATGTISAVTTVQVGSQVSGIVSRLYADYNSPVKRGQLLAELDPTPFEAQVEQRRADVARTDVELRNAQISFSRSERLLAEALVAQADYDAAKTAYDAARADVAMSAASLRQAQTNLSYTKIYSPIDGVVVARQYDVGQTVAASFQAPTLFTIAEDLTKMQVQADVDQSDIGRIGVGQTTRFTVDAYPDENFIGRISQIRLNATQNQNVITYPVIIDVANPEGKLKPKMTADVTIEVARVADVLRVPNAALRFRPIEFGNTGRGGSDRAVAANATGAGRAAAGGAESRRAGAGAVAAEAPRGAGLPGAAGTLVENAPRPKRGQTIYLVGSDGSLRQVSVRTGITDGRYTAVVEGDLEPGDRIAVGFATAKSEQTGTFPGMGPAPGGGRRF